MDVVHEPGRHLTVRPGSQARFAGFEVHREPIYGGICIIGGLPVTSPLQTVVGCMKVLPLREAVVIADSAMRAGLDFDLLEGKACRLKGPRSARVRAAVEASDPEAGSVAESLARILFLEHGLPRPETQRRFEGLYRADVLTLRGWKVLRFTWEDVTQDPRFVLDCASRALDHPRLPRKVVRSGA